MTPDALGAAARPALQRTLHNRHIQLMAMGGAIGTGLFMGSGKLIAMSGTSIILIYMIIGLFVYLVMRAMGELLLSNLQFKSFADFAGAYLGPRAAFFDPAGGRGRASARSQKDRISCAILLL